MWNTLEKIRQKPLHVRKLYAFWGALFCTLVVAIVWMFSLRDLFTQEAVTEKPLQETESSFFKEFGEVLGNVRDLRYLFTGTVEYQAPKEPEPRQQMIDLNALVASSTRAQKALDTTKKTGTEATTTAP